MGNAGQGDGLGGSIQMLRHVVESADHDQTYRQSLSVKRDQLGLIRS